MSTLNSVTDNTFDNDVLQSQTPVLVDFWAEWCGPCRRLAPILEELAQEYGNKVKILKLDIDANPITPTKYGVRGIPTLILYKEGKVIATKVGVSAKTGLSDFLNSHL